MHRMKKTEIEVEYETDKGWARLRHEPKTSDHYSVRIYFKGSYMPVMTVKHTRAEAMQVIREQLL